MSEVELNKIERAVLDAEVSRAETVAIPTRLARELVDRPEPEELEDDSIESIKEQIGDVYRDADDSLDTIDLAIDRLRLILDAAGETILDDIVSEVAELRRHMKNLHHIEVAA